MTGFLVKKRNINQTNILTCQLPKLLPPQASPLNIFKDLYFLNFQGGAPPKLRNSGGPPLKNFANTTLQNFQGWVSKILGGAAPNIFETQDFENIWGTVTIQWLSQNIWGGKLGNLAIIKCVLVILFFLQKWVISIRF